MLCLMSLKWSMLLLGKKMNPNFIHGTLWSEIILTYYTTVCMDKQTGESNCVIDLKRRNNVTLIVSSFEYTI